jgi:GT2 family glycosyltransferase
MMVDAALYAGLGGMSWRYVQGDFEDADFSLRLAGEGRTRLYVPEVSLYHLEAQSYPPAARAANRRYNRWLFTRLWEEALEERAVRPS